MLKHVCDENILSWTQTFILHWHFTEGRDEVRDDEHSGRSVTAQKGESISKVVLDCNQQQITYDQKQTAEGAGILEIMCKQILTEDLKMHQVYQHIIPCTLTEDVMVIRMKMVGDLISATNQGPQFLRIIMGDEKWCLPFPVSWHTGFKIQRSIFKCRNEKHISGCTEGHCEE